MGGRDLEKKLYSFALLTLVFMANIAVVEDLFNQGTCDWICATETDIDKESRDMMAQGRLVKLKVLYEERVDEECANQTDVSNSSTSSSLWFKMAANHNKTTKKLQGRLQFFTQTILEGIVSGEFAFGGYKEINVSCIFKSTSVKRSASSRRLTFHTPQSTLYCVEQHADFTKSNGNFLTLLRNESHTRLSVDSTGATGSLASIKSTKDSELIFSNGWFIFVAVIIWIVFLLYSNAIFILFRPSEVTLHVIRKTPREYRPSNVQESGTPIEDEELGDEILPRQDGSDLFTHESGNPIEGEDEGNELTPRGVDNIFSGSAADVPEGSDMRTHPFALEETKQPADKDSKMVIALQRTYKGKMHSPKDLGRIEDCDDLPQDRDDTYDSPPALDSGFAINWRQVSPLRTTTWPDKSSATVKTTDSAVTNRSDEEPNSFDVEEEDLSGSSEEEESNGSNSNAGSFNGFDRDHEELSNQPDRSIEGQSGSNRHDDTAVNGSHIISVIDPMEDPRQTSENASQVDRSVSSTREEETEYIRLVIVGDTYPVGVGSFIGNKLFLNMNVNRNNFLNMVKLIFIFVVPLLYFTGLGDLFLLLLPNLQSKMADHLPFPFFTSSIVYGAITTHPAVLLLIVVSAICHLIRLFFVCFLSRKTLESSWNPCFVHRMHPTCFTCRLVQSFLSEFPPPKSFCVFNRVCSRHHLRCTVCYLFYKARLICYWFYKGCLSHKACEDCEKPAPPECSKYLDLPDNISHNLEKWPDIFIKYWDSFFECLSKLGETKSIVCCLQVIFFPLAVVPLIVDVISLSPLVCLCYGRLWMLNERYKNKFWGSKYILPILDFLLIFFSLIWVTFFAFSSAVPLGVATVGLIKVLETHAKEVLQLIVIVFIAVYYFWSCYRSFTTPFRELAKSLASPYQKKFDELDKKPEVRNVLVHYKLGEQGNHIKVIPKELFTEGCKEFKLLIKNKFTVLLCKLGLMLLVVLFVFPIIRTDDVDPTILPFVIGFLTYPCKIIIDALNGGKFEVSKEDAEKVVDEFIKRKQDSS